MANSTRPGPTKIFDRERLAAIAQGSAVSEREVLAEFRRVNAQDAALLHQAARAGDFTQVGTHAHRMEGAGAMLGANRLAGACSFVAMAAGSGDPAAVQTALALFERQMVVLNDHLDTLVAAAPAVAPSDSLVDAGGDRALCRNLSFMVVEDHDFQRALIVRLLHQLGAREVEDFADCASVLRALGDGAQSADIIVLDLAMSGMNGMDLMQMLGATRHRGAVILNSALNSRDLAPLVQTARGYGVNLLGAVSKPLIPANLAPLIALYRSGTPAVPATPTFLDTT